MTLDEIMEGLKKPTKQAKPQQAETDPQEEDEEEEQETTKAPKVEEDTCDRSKPLLERIDGELEGLKLTAGLMGDYNRMAAHMLGKCLKAYLQDPNNKGNAKTLCEKWDENKWTLQLVWEAVFETAKKELNSKSCGVDGETVMGWVSHIVIDTKPKAKEPATTPKKPATTQNETTTPKKKPAPKKQEKPQKQLNLDSILGL